MAVNNRLATSGRATLKSQVDQMMPAIKRALPKTITPERFSRIVVTAISNNPNLQRCTPESFIGAMMNAAQLGLEPNTPLGQAYLIPYGNSCQFQIGYQGLIDVARRAGTMVSAHEVKENDEFTYTLGLNPNIVHKPALNNRGKTIGYYGIWKNKDQYGFEFKTLEEIKEFAKDKSKSFGNGPWQTDFDAMAKKTVIKMALKYAPKAVELEQAMASDDTTKSVRAEDTSDMNFDINLVQAEEQKDVIDADTGEVVSPTVPTAKKQPPIAEEESLI